MFHILCIFLRLMRFLVVLDVECMRRRLKIEAEFLSYFTEKVELPLTVI